MEQKLRIKAITHDKLAIIYNWYQNKWGTFFVVDPYLKSVFVSYEKILKFFENKFFVYEYFITELEKEIGLIRMFPDFNNFSLIFDVWFNEFFEEKLLDLVKFLKNYWLYERKFYKLETRVIFEKDYLKIYKRTGFKTESVLREEFFYDGSYFSIENLAFLKNA